MSAERWARLEALFQAAETLPPSERAAFLETECPDDAELRAEVRALLEQVTDHPTTDPLRDMVAAASRDAIALEGTRIDTFEIEDRLGSGGMGDVYRARQTEPVERTVALKVIKRGMDTDRILARFEIERRTVARMDHPGIATVHQAGATPDGRPYFAMELVDGPTITEYARQSELDLGARLDLFVQVCEAVHHAHQKGIVHRDLKPSNILIKRTDGVATAKIIDFGIAKATDAETGEHSFYTEAGVLVGTPEYMSPEQITSGGSDLDTRSDIYALGLILHEILTGDLPFDRSTLRARGFAELERIIVESEAAKPSSRPGCRHLRGDLDWIILKALAKERDRRYDSAAEFAKDIVRFRSNEPVLASSPTTFYRLGKFARRNRGWIASGVAILLALAGGLVVALVQLDAARDARDDSVATLDFLTDLLLRIEPDQRGDRDVTVRQVLDEAEGEVAKFEGRPRIEARLRYTIGRVYLALGAWAEAERHLPRALTLYTTLEGERHPDTIQATVALGSLYGSLGRYDEGEALLESGGTAAREVHGADHPLALEASATLADHLRDRGQNERAREILLNLVERTKTAGGERHADYLARLGVMEGVVGNRQESISRLRAAVETLRSSLGADHRKTLFTQHSLAVSLVRAQPAEALDLLVATLATQREVLGPDHPDALLTEFDLALQHKRSGNRQDAAAGLDAVIPRLERVKGASQRTTLAARTARAGLYVDGGELDQGLEALLHVHALQAEHLGADHRDTVSTETHLAETYRQLGRHDDALRYIEHAVAARSDQLGPTHPLTLTARTNHGAILFGAGKVEECVDVHLATYRDAQAELGEVHPEALNCLAHAIHALRTLERHDEEVPLVEEIVARLRAAHGGDHRDTLEFEHRLAHAFESVERFDEARALYTKSYEQSRPWGIRDAKFQEYGRCQARFLERRSEHARAAEVHRATLEAARSAGAPPSPLSRFGIDLALSLLAQGETAAAEAETVLREVLELRRSFLTPDDWRLPNIESMVGETLVLQNRLAEAEPLLLEAHAALTKAEGTPPPRLDDSRRRLETLYLQWGKPERAAQYRLTP